MNTSIIILNIHTCTETAIVNIAKNGVVAGELQNGNAKEHGQFLHLAIEQLLCELELKPSDISAVAVTVGPGSYTGIRVGFAAAKGLCYALNLPLIAVNTLEFLASCSENQNAGNNFLIPMIDARRMEVFTAVYTPQMEVVIPPKALILDENSYADYRHSKVLLFGSGSEKFKDSIASLPAGFSFAEVAFDGFAFARLTLKKYYTTNFVNVAYSEPQYLKEFFTTAAR